MVAPDLWHNLFVDEWQRVQLLHVPPKLLKEGGTNSKAWSQYEEAKRAAKHRAGNEAPQALEAELRQADRRHAEIYKVAVARISAVLADHDHYMHNKLEKVEMEFKISVNKPKGRAELFNQLVHQTPVSGQHKWLHHRKGVVCELCGKKIKSCSTISEISSKQATPCAGEVTLTLKQLMASLVQDTEGLPDSAAGHRWTIGATSFSCQRCWIKLPLRCGKDALERLCNMTCHFGRVGESDLNLRPRVHPSHDLWRRGDWLECQKCHRTTTDHAGKVQKWLSTACLQSGRQQTLQFSRRSSDS